MTFASTIVPLDAPPENHAVFLEEISLELGVLYGRAAACAFLSRARQSLREQLQRPDILGWRAVAGSGETTGMIVVALDGAQAKVALLHVIEKHRGKGVELKLMRHALSRLRHHGIDCFLYDTAPTGDIDLTPLEKDPGFLRCPRLLMGARADAIARVSPVSKTSTRPFLSDHMDGLTECLLRAYQGHVDADLFREVSVKEEALIFFHSVLQGAYGEVTSEWLRSAWCGPLCTGGIVTCRFFPNNYFLLQVFVHPRYQRRGVGASLIGDVARILATEDENATLTLGVTATNPARRLYEQLGFETLRKMDCYVWRCPEKN